LSDSEAIRASRNVLTAFAAIKLDDVMRDERGVVKRELARLLRRVCGFLLPRGLNAIVKKSNAAVHRLENSEIDAPRYVKEISKIGGEIFERASGKKSLHSVGSTLAGTITLQDMATDLEKDLKSGDFNPLITSGRASISPECRQLLNRYLRKFRNLMKRVAPTGHRRLDERGVGTTGWCCAIITCIICVSVISDLLKGKPAEPPPPRPIPQPRKPRLKPAQIESMVYGYIVSHGGEIDVTECAEELGLSEREVRAAVEALKAKGKVAEE
jgi:hypothetical protein